VEVRARRGSFSSKRGRRRRSSGLLWQAGAVSAPLMVKYAIDHGVLTKGRHTLLIWLGALLGVGLLLRHVSPSEAARSWGQTPPACCEDMSDSAQI